jgi:arsenate reductase-like glutaredoxin family protein
MAARIDWYYRRKSCSTCQKTDAYLEKVGAQAHEVVDAVKVRYSEAEALQLLTGAQTLVAAKGKKVVRVSLTQDRPTDAELLALVMGPTGNLRAPTLRVGSTMLVGYEPGAYGEVIGA